MTLQQQLDDALAAYHNLQTGKSARVVVDGGDGSRVEYTAANRSELYSYIQSLKAQLPSATNPRYSNGPASFIF